MKNKIYMINRKYSISLHHIKFQCLYISIQEKKYNQAVYDDKMLDNLKHYLGFNTHEDVQSI